MIAIVWRYEVEDEHRAVFEATYGPDGDWARLFARNDGFRSTTLLREEDGSYLTIDSWRAMADFEAFMTENRPEYDALDDRAGAWTRGEHRIGHYEVLGEEP